MEFYDFEIFFSIWIPKIPMDPNTTLIIVSLIKFRSPEYQMQLTEAQIKEALLLKAPAEKSTNTAWFILCSL
jgi:hypothetical protein